MGRGRTLLYGVDVLPSCNEFGAYGYAAGGFHFVAGQHPNLDAGVAEEFERGLDVFLELVLDAGHAE